MSNTDRRRMAKIWSVLVPLAAWLALMVSAETPVEEKEESKPPKLRSDLPLLPPLESLKRIVVQPLGEMVLAAEQASHPVIRDLLRRLAYPHDRMILQNGQVLRIAPLPRPWELEKSPQIKVQVLDATGQLEAQRSVSRNEVQRVEYFENFATQHVLQVAEEAGRLKPPLQRSQVLQVADFVLEQVRAFHREAVRRGQRAEGWAHMEDVFQQQQKQVSSELLSAWQQEQRWAEAIAWVEQRLEERPKDSTLANQFRQLIETIAERAISQQDYPAVRRALDRLRRRLPSATSPAIERYQRVLQDYAQSHLTRAWELLEKEEWVSAWHAGAEAARLRPNWDRIQLFQRQLLRKYPFLIVAVPDLPQTTWPLLATGTSDRMAVAVTYEWLVEPRSPPLSFNGYWSSPGFVLFRDQGAWVWSWPAEPLLFFSPSGERPVRWQDVEFSLACAGQPKQFLYAPHRDRRWTSWRSFESNTGQWRVEVPLAGYDPLQLFCVPLLPAQDSTATKPERAGDSFPMGSGPYYLAQRSEKEWVFRARAGWSRPHAPEGPALREIRFRPYTNVTQAYEDLECGAVHVVVGLTARDADLFQGIPHARVLCLARQETTPAGTIYTPKVAMLAFHRRRPAVQSTELRQAFSAAIDREAILRTLYRGRDPTTYRLSGGLAPLASWAYHPDYVPTLRSLYRPAQARELFHRAQKTKPAPDGHQAPFSASGNTLPRLTLWCPADEPQAYAAALAIRDQLADYGLTLAVRPVTRRELWAAWQTAQPDFDLMLWLAEYPWEGVTPFCWLSPATPSQSWPDPFGLADEPTVAQLRQRFLQTDDLAVARRTLHQLHAHLVDQAWIAPLWEVEHFAVVWQGLRVARFHPCWFFHHVEIWSWN